MIVRAIVCGAITGQRLGEIDLVGDWSATTSVRHTGTLSGAVTLNRTTPGTTGPDHPAMRTVIDMTRPGLNTVALHAVQQVVGDVPERGSLIQASRRVLGEWVLAEVEPRYGWERGIEGDEWTQYPRFNTIDQATKATGVDAGVVAQQLVWRAYDRATPDGMPVHVPAVTAGHSVTVDVLPRSGQWMDAIDDVCGQAPGMEWVIDVTPTWESLELMSVARTVRWGVPVVRRSSPIELMLPEIGMAMPTVVDFRGGGESFRDYSAEVYGLGSGSGDKQLTTSKWDHGLTSRGWLRASSSASFNVTTQAELDALTQGELDAAQSRRAGQVALPRRPWEITARVDMLPALPRLGDEVRVLSRNHPQFPHRIDHGDGWGPMGINEVVRVGEVTYQGSGSLCELVTIKAV